MKILAFLTLLSTNSVLARSPALDFQQRAECACNVNGSVDLDCDPTSGQCQCLCNVEGLNCDTCTPGYYSFPDCHECQCNDEGSDTFICDVKDGSCHCVSDLIVGKNCDQSKDGYWGFPNPQECLCNEKGSAKFSCEDDTGICSCKENIIGDKCDQCAEEHYGFPDCDECTCNKEGSKDNTCDITDGDCNCHENIHGKDCDSCVDGFYGFPKCLDCSCFLEGSNSKNCDAKTGQCDCKENFVGKTCEECASGFFDFPKCDACNCNEDGSTSIECNDKGVCDCKANISGDKCDQPETGFFGFPSPSACNCDAEGSVSNECDADGKCTCKDKVVGDKCDQCAPEFMNFPNCGCGDCPSGWVPVGDYCYMFGSGADSYSDAKQKCKDKGAKLFEPKSQLTNDEVFKMLQHERSSDKAWIGLNDKANEGVFVYTSNGEAITYTNWNAGEPNNYKDREDCVHFTEGGTWNDEQCSTDDIENYICEKCPGWVSIKGASYLFVQKEVTYEQAEQGCKDKGSKLFEPKDKETNDQVFVMLGKELGNDDAWIGINDQATEGAFVYSSNDQSVGFTNWNSGEPNDSGSGEDCVHYTDDGLWNDLPCTNTVKSYICEKGPKWASLGGKNYLIVQQSVSFATAKTECENQGAKLFEPMDQETNDAVFNLLQTESGLEKAWIGVQDQTTEGQYEFASSNDQIKFTNWNDGEPNDNNGNEDCVHFVAGGFWNDQPCEDPDRYVKAFICEQ